MRLTRLCTGLTATLIAAAALGFVADAQQSKHL